MHARDLFEYDLEFVVPGQNRAAYEEWRPQATCRWGFDDRVVLFDEQHNDTGMGPECRFVFGFESLRDWASFVEGPAHSENMATLQELASEVRGTLWHPTAPAASTTPATGES